MGRGHGAIVRPCADMVCSIAIQPTLNGRDSVSALTLAGNTLFTKEYGMHEVCRVFQFREQMHDALVADGIIGHHTKVKLLKPPEETPLRGSRILKHAQKQPKDKFLYKWDVRQPRLKKFLKNQAREKAQAAASSTDNQNVASSSSSTNAEPAEASFVYNCVCARYYKTR